MRRYFRVLVTGSRGWTEAAAVGTALGAMAVGARAGGYDGMTVVHGAARGADTFADQWARVRNAGGLPIEPEPHPADWAGRGKAAGGERNLAMVKLGADVCIAFIGPCTNRRCRKPKPHDSHGTTQCMTLAERYGIHVVSIRPVVS